MGNTYKFRVFAENKCGISEDATESKEEAKIIKTGTPSVFALTLWFLYRYTIMDGMVKHLFDYRIYALNGTCSAKTSTSGTFSGLQNGLLSTIRCLL